METNWWLYPLFYKKPAFKLTFLHNNPPPLGPVTELKSVVLFYLGSLLKAGDQLIAQPVAIVNPLYRPFVVPRLQRNTNEPNGSEETERRQSLPEFCSCHRCIKTLATTVWTEAYLVDK